MMENIVYYSIMLILVGEHIFNVILELINTKYSKTTALTEIITDVYYAQSYSQQQAYHAETLKLSLVEGTLLTLLTVTSFGLGYFGLLSGFAADFTRSPVIQSLTFFGSIWIASQLVSLPFDYYRKFVIEERYGFNRSSRRLFAVDTLKSALLTIVMGGILLSLISWLYVNYVNLFCFFVLVVLVIVSLVSTLLYTSLILPLFNRKTPLPEGELKERLEQLAQRTGFEAKNIFVLDSSKRSTKGNAFFTGWGRNKRIYLYDTLIDSLLPDEIEAVLAHEIGHYKKRHVWVNLAISLTVTALFLYLFSWASRSNILVLVMGATPSDIPNFHLNILGFALIFSPIQFVIGLFTNYLSRRMEFAADAFAREQGLAESLVVALKKLAAQNYSDLTPHPYYVAMHYSHPPLVQRIESLMHK